MWILPWIRTADKKGVARVLVFMYEGGLWETDETSASEEFLTEEYLEGNGLGEPGPASFWLADGTIWCPQLDPATDLGDFYWEKDQPAADALRWSILYWTKEDLGINQFHKRQQLIEGKEVSVWDFLVRALEGVGTWGASTQKKMERP